MAAKEISEVPILNTEDLELKGFKVHELAASRGSVISPGRRDFYKMGVVTGEMTVYCGDRILEIHDTALLFLNPDVVHSAVIHSKLVTGYACLFTSPFIVSRDRAEPLKDSPLFHAGDTPLISLNDEQAAFMTGIFQKMLMVYHGDYPHKGELVRSCVELIMHEALRIQPSQNVPQFKNAATRITHLFTDLLERQFPIERASDALKLRTAQDFAAGLSVHVNYLNRAVKEVTGKPTSVHIAARITAEAKALLQYTDWSIAEIAYALGFEYTTYFNNYFKRVTGTTPKSIRKDKV